MTTKSLLLLLLIILSGKANSQDSLRRHAFYLEYKEGISIYPTDRYGSEPTPYKSYSIQWLTSKGKRPRGGFRLGLT